MDQKNLGLLEKAIERYEIISPTSNKRMLLMKPESQNGYAEWNFGLPMGLQPLTALRVFVPDFATNPVSLVSARSCKKLQN